MTRTRNKAGSRRNLSLRDPATGHTENKRQRAFTFKFLLASALAIIPLSLIPEAWYTPLNRLIAYRVADVLGLLIVNPTVHGTTISIGGFAVKVISECTAVYLIALYAAFIFAFPAGRPEKWIGLGAGAVLLSSINIIRIAAVTLISHRFPHLFEAVHVYLGQMGMTTATVAICLLWCNWLSAPAWKDGPAGFILRFVVISAPFFLIWLPLNRIFISVIDAVITALFRLAAHPVAIPRTHALYYQTFSLVTLCSLLFAVTGAQTALRFRMALYGVAVVTLFQFAFRLCNVWMQGFQMEWMEPVSQVVYVCGVHALPLIIALRFLFQARSETESS